MAMYCELSFTVVTVYELSGGPVHRFLMVITLSTKSEFVHPSLYFYYASNVSIMYVMGV